MARKDTVFAHMARELGLMEATRVQMYLTWWAMFMLAHDREPMDIEEMAAELTAVSAATLYRRQASFRKAFPQYDTPKPLVEKVWEQMRARRKRIRVPTPREWRDVTVT